MSPAARYLLGFDREEQVGDLIDTLLHPDDRPLVAAAIKEVLEGSPSKKYTYRIRRKDGTYTWFESISQAVRDPGDMHVLQIHSVARDVSERVRKRGRTLPRT